MASGHPFFIGAPCRWTLARPCHPCVDLSLFSLNPRSLLCDPANRIAWGPSGLLLRVPIEARRRGALALAFLPPSPCFSSPLPASPSACISTSSSVDSPCWTCLGATTARAKVLAAPRRRAFGAAAAEALATVEKRFFRAVVLVLARALARRAEREVAAYMAATAS